MFQRADEQRRLSDSILQTARAILINNSVKSLIMWLFLYIFAIRTWGFGEQCYNLCNTVCVPYRILFYSVGGGEAEDIWTSIIHAKMIVMLL